MCDTIVALGKATLKGKVLFAKNTDRDPNEAHELLIVPAADHQAGSMLQCTYITIPQAQHTHKVFLARPFWLWGAEMGMNEHGVAIGNEAVFTKVPREKTNGLIGMDLLRLALERAVDAPTALKVIVELLEKYGQGGNCGFSHPFYYDNSFIIADRQQAWVLETAGRHWVAEKVQGVRSISNALTIGDHWDLISPELVNYARSRGWCKSEQDLNFARSFSEPIYTRLGAGVPRQACTMDFMGRDQGKLTLQSFFGFLRSHAQPGTKSKGIGAQAKIVLEEGRDWSPDRAILGAQVCMHTGWGPVRESQSVGSMVAVLDAAGDEIWATGTSAPCTSVFKPIWLDAGLPDLAPSPSGEYDELSLWWRHEVLHREVLRDFPIRLAAYAELRDVLENEFVENALAVQGLEPAARLQYTIQCFQKADQARQEWLQRVRAVTPRSAQRFYYKIAWNRINRKAKFDRIKK